MSNHTPRGKFLPVARRTADGAAGMAPNEGSLYYKTENPKAFGKAMNKYLDKPIERS